MAREIKFRVWDSISKRMYEWDEIKHIPLVDFDLDHYTLMQFTGLKDSSGVDIWEGDIVNVPYNNIGNHVVEMVRGRWNTSNYNLKSVKVIGNIHENKDLLT